MPAPVSTLGRTPMREWLTRALRRLAEWLAPARPLATLPEALSETQKAREFWAQFERARELAIEMVRTERASQPQTAAEREHEAQRSRFAEKLKKAHKMAERF